MSYGSNAGATTYHALHGNTAWADGSDANQTIARLRGSEYIDQNWRGSFPGLKTGLRAQIREWPRTSAFDDQGNVIASADIPTEVDEATYEAALRELVTPGTLFPDYDPATQVRTEKIGPLGTENTAPHGPASVRKMITIIRGILAPILTGPGATSSLSGRSVRV